MHAAVSLNRSSSHLARLTGSTGSTGSVFGGVFWAACWSAFWVAAALAPLQLSAQSSVSPTASESAARGLKRGGYPWYDSNNDQVRRVDVQSNEDDFAGRHSEWSNKTKPNNPPKTQASSGLEASMNLLVWIFATILLVGLIAILIWYFLDRANQPMDGEFGEAPEERVRLDRVEELPVTVDAQRGDLLSQAKHHFANNNLRDAIICLFSYKLLQLDNHQAIHLERGKTNRQYIRELRQRPDLRGFLEGTMLAFEDVFFGNHELSHDRVQSCLQVVEPFHLALKDDGGRTTGGMA